MPKPLRRTTYRDRTPPHPMRSGPATRAEAGLDFESYYQPLVAALLSSHGAGVLTGLKVSATLGASGLVVTPGVALDAQGRLVVLGESGNAEIGASADATGAVPLMAPVTAAGVRVPTAGLTGAKLLVVRVWETFDESGFSNTGAQRMDQTPWFQFVDPSIFVEDGNRIVLAVVTFGTGAQAGNVTALSPSRRTLVRVDHGLEFRGLAFGEGLATQDAPLARLDGNSGRRGITLSVPSGPSTIAELTFQPAGDNQTFLSLSGGSRRLEMEAYSIVTGLLTFTPRENNGLVQLSPAGGSVLLLRGASGDQGVMELNPGEIHVSRCQEFVIGTDAPRGVRIAGNLTVDGAATFRGPKVGFLVDAFRNGTERPLEIGDVVVVAPGARVSTDDGCIPIPDVETATTAYDSRACGIVSEGAGPGACGHMVTLGCWGHCKVDADISPIAAGDLLTTSATPGHAQKVIDRAEAIGAIIGKALAPLASGRGLIPVLVSLH